MVNDFRVRSMKLMKQPPYERPAMPSNGRSAMSYVDIVIS